MDAKIVREPAKEELDCMVTAAFPDSDGYSVKMLKGGLFNTSYLLEVNGKKYVLRVGPVRRELLLPYEHYLMDAEAWAYRELGKIGIPTSVVVHIDTSKKLLDRDFMIVEYIESRGMKTAQWSEEESNSVYREVGAYTRRMTEITGDKFGRVGFILRGEGYDTWSEYIKAELSQWADSIRRNTTDYYTEDELFRIVAIADKYKDILDDIKTPRFNHCDLWTLNVLIPENGEAKVAAIIDPDRCCMGDPDYELSSGWMMNNAFYEGYGRYISDDERTNIRTDIYRMMFLFLNGYFMWVEYDDKKPSFGDKEGGMKYLVKLENRK